MKDRLIQELLDETTMKDIPVNYQTVVEIIGLKNFAKLSDYAKGDEIYFPKVENIVAPARNRRIQKEYNGYNRKELAVRYNLTIQQIDNIIKDVPPPGQIDMFKWANAEGKEI